MILPSLPSILLALCIFCWPVSLPFFNFLVWVLYASSGHARRRRKQEKRAFIEILRVMFLNGPCEMLRRKRRTRAGTPITISKHARTAGTSCTNTAQNKHRDSEQEKKNKDRTYVMSSEINIAFWALHFTYTNSRRSQVLIEKKQRKIIRRSETHHYSERWATGPNHDNDLAIHWSNLEKYSKRSKIFHTAGVPFHFDY